MSVPVRRVNRRLEFGEQVNDVVATGNAGVRCVGHTLGLDMLPRSAAFTLRRQRSGDASEDTQIRVVKGVGTRNRRSARIGQSPIVQRC
jgi:hypothetical protein